MAPYLKTTVISINQICYFSFLLEIITREIISFEKFIDHDEKFKFAGYLLAAIRKQVKVIKSASLSSSLVRLGF